MAEKMTVRNINGKKTFIVEKEVMEEVCGGFDFPAYCTREVKKLLKAIYFDSRTENVTGEYKYNGRKDFKINWTIDTADYICEILKSNGICSNATYFAEKVQSSRTGNYYWGVNLIVFKGLNIELIRNSKFIKEEVEKVNEIEAEILGLFDKI